MYIIQASKQMFCPNFQNVRHDAGLYQILFEQGFVDRAPVVQGSQRALHTQNDPSTVTGSERVRASVASGAQLRETCAINASLTALGRVISELVEAQRRPSAAHHHVPFRDSRLTFLLQARHQGLRAAREVRQ